MPIETVKLSEIAAQNLLGAGDIAAGTLIYVAHPTGEEGVYEPAAVAAGDLAQWIKTAESIVPASVPWRGARAVRTITLTSFTDGLPVTWQATDIDTDSFWSAGAPTRLTVPAGVSKVRLYGGLAFEVGGIAGTVGVGFRKGGDTFVAQAQHRVRSGTTGATQNRAMAVSGVLAVDAGDYFELLGFVTMSGIDEVLAGAQSFFEIEVVEAIPEE